jgi:hypothetical protein
MAQNILIFSHLRPTKIYPNWDENIPSGNPGVEAAEQIRDGMKSFCSPLPTSG